MKFVPPDLRTGEHVFHWQEEPSKIQQGRKSGRWVKVDILDVKGSMVDISTGASIFQVNASKQRRPLDTVDLEELPDSRERTGAPVRTVLLTTLICVLFLIDKDLQWQSQLTVKIKIQKAFHRSHSRAFGQSSKIRSPRSLWCPRRLLPKTPSRRKSFGNSAVCAWPKQNIKSVALDSLAWKDVQVDLSYFGQSTSATSICTRVTQACCTNRMANPSSSWRLHVQDKDSFNPSVTVSPTCANQWLSRPCSSQSTKGGSSMCNELN